MAVRDEDQMEGMPTGFTEVDKVLGGARRRLDRSRGST